MTEKEVRMRIPENIYKRYRLICVENDLSMPKQTAELVLKFVEIQEENNKKIKAIKK